MGLQSAKCDTNTSLFCQPLCSPQVVDCTFCRYSPEASKDEEDPPQGLLRSSIRHARTAGPDHEENSMPGLNRHEDEAAPRVRLRWSGRPESLSSLPPVHDMLRLRRGRPDATDEIVEGRSASGLRAPRPRLQYHNADETAGGQPGSVYPALRLRSQDAGLSPDHSLHSLRRSQRSTRSAASPSPVPEDISRHHAVAEANDSAPSMPSSLPRDAPSASANGSAHMGGFSLAPVRSTRSRHRHTRSNGMQSLGRSARQTHHDEAPLDKPDQMHEDDQLPDEQEQIEEAIRQSLLSREEQHQGEDAGPSTAPPATTQKGRSGLRIKLRGAS